jgi:predicted Rossmann-fold nucleotide-binding protein
MEDTRQLIEEQAAHWKATGYDGELLQQHQDTDAVAELADTIGGRILVSGSARLKEGTPDYDAARWIIATLVEGLPHPDGTTEQVITGAGPGIMEAGNRGAMEGAWKHLHSLLQEGQDGTRDRGEVWNQIANFRLQMQSVGARIILPFEAGWNDHLQLNLTIKSFGPRKLALVSVAGGRSMRQPREKNTNGWHGRSPAMFSFTGGFGTADEDWELLTLAQCGKMQNPVPLFIVGHRKIEAMERTLDDMEHDGTIVPDDRKLVIFCENEIVAVERYLEHHGLSVTPRIAVAIDERRGRLALFPDAGRG